MSRKHNKLQMQALALVILLGGFAIGREMWKVEHPEPVVEMLSPQTGRACVYSNEPIPYWAICPWEAAPVIWGDQTMNDHKIFVRLDEPVIERVEF